METTTEPKLPKVQRCLNKAKNAHLKAINAWSNKAWEASENGLITRAYVSKTAHL